jgi:hypothetical protein
MLAKIKSPVFIDALQLMLSGYKGNCFKGVLKDDKGSIISKDQEEFNWTGLNDLPYGQYTLEVMQGENEIKMKLVKRV